MRTHAKAPSAGSTEPQASGLGRFFRGGFATRGIAGDASGSGAPKGGHPTPNVPAFLTTLLVSLFALALLAVTASAAPSRPYLEDFGGAGGPTFNDPKAIAVDQGTGDLIVANGTFSATLTRFDEDGNPANFSALGTNVIDGMKGPGGKPCAEEPASCDAVPQGEFTMYGPKEVSVVIDESGGPTDGNIYLTLSEAPVVDIFAADGHFLGQLTGTDTTAFNEVYGLGVDSQGAIYVGNYPIGVSKFVPSGNYPVNGDFTETFSDLENVRHVVVGGGPTEGSLFVTQRKEYPQPPSLFKISAETGAVDYEFPGLIPSVQVVNPASGNVFVAAESEVSEFDASGAAASKRSEIHGAGQIATVSVNAADDLVYVLGSSGKIEIFGPAPPIPLALTGAASNLSAGAATLNASINPKGVEVESCVFEWGETSAPYDHTTPCAETSAQIGEGTASVSVHADLSGLTGGTTYHYRVVATNVNGSDEASDRIFFTPAPPLISEESVQSVSRTEATLTFKVNPLNFLTSYHLEYGPAGQPYDHSTAERGVGSDGVDHALVVNLKGLTPGTSYHWRVVATNLDPAFPGTGTANGDEHKFRTVGILGLNTSCPNQTFRTGVAAKLPDCRAYEMVSPVNKNNGDIVAFLSFGASEWTGRAAYDQAAIDGNKLTYAAGTPFGDTVAGRNSNQYMATRGASGWSTHSLNAPGGQIVEQAKNITYTLETPFTLFTPDLSEALVQDARIPPLAAGAVEGMPNLLRRNNLSESYEALTNEEPAGRPEGPEAYEYLFRMRGHSSDFSDVLFEVEAPMTPDSFPTNAFNISQTYVTADGDLHLASVMPDGRAYQNKSAGAALSEDGSRAYWTLRVGPPFTLPGTVFLRENPTQPQSAQALGSARGTGNLTIGSNEITGVNTTTGAFAVGQDIISSNGAITNEDFLPEGTTITAVGPDSLTLSANALSTQSGYLLIASSECTEPDKACTIPVSPTAPGGNAAQFMLASADGSKALFDAQLDPLDVKVKDLYEFDATTRTSTLIAHKSKGTVGASKDASRLYFVSEADLAAGATEGEPNLYLRQGGVNTFVVTLAAGDIDTNGAGTSILTGEKPQERGNRVSADGSHLLFMSASKALAEQVADYDNTDAISGKADREVYLYEVGGELRCISCNPTGARPVGQAMEQSFNLPESKSRLATWAAAWIPGWEHQLLAQRVMMDDGSRVFFNAFDALVPGDTNGTLDVYQWELPGSGDCTTANTTYSEQNGGCISLISSGQSPQISEFIDASADGKDVFFTTASSLLPQDPGLVDMYDARVGGGFPQPPGRPAICEGEACQGAPTPPNDPTPASAAYNGPGNVNEASAKKKKSKKHKHKKKNKHKKQKKKGGKSKRAANNSTRRNG